MQNRTLGNHFEDELCNILSCEGFWVHKLTQNQAGQPADILAILNGIPIIIDCKVCSNNKFSFDRIEPNQESSMTFWTEKVNDFVYFAIQLSSGNIIMISYEEISFLQSFGASNISDFRPYDNINDWIEEMKELCANGY